MPFYFYFILFIFYLFIFVFTVIICLVKLFVLLVIWSNIPFCPMSKMSNLCQARQGHFCPFLLHQRNHFQFMYTSLLAHGTPSKETNFRLYTLHFKHIVHLQLTLKTTLFKLPQSLAHFFSHT